MTSKKKKYIPWQPPKAGDTHGIISPELKRLTDYLKMSGVVKNAYFDKHELKDVGVGDYIPSRGTVAVVAGSQDRGDAVLAHELLHTIAGSNRKSRVNKIEDLTKDLPWLLRRKLVYPARWEEGRLEDTDISQQVDSYPLREMADKTISRKNDIVTNAIPEGERWSGLRKGQGLFSRDDRDEVESYYHTYPDLGSVPLSERAKDLGMYLRSYDVPMSIVAPVVERLGKIAKPEKRYSGGKANLRELRATYGEKPY